MRRAILCCLVVVSFLGPAAYAEPKSGQHAVLIGPAPGEARWTSGFWGDRLATCRERMIPTMWRVMSGTQHSQFLENFRVAAGMAQGRHRGPKWNDGDFYKFLEAAAAVYAIERDPELDRVLDQSIEVVAKAQRADGYLHTPVLISERNDGTRKPLADPLDFEMYNMGHLMTAACAHYRATGKSNLLQVARKAGDYLNETFARSGKTLAAHGICPSHYMGLVELYRTTGEPRYLELARKLIDLRGTAASGTDDNQDRLPFHQQSKAVGHAVRANYLYAGVADVYAESGDAMLLDPLKKIWDDLVTRKLYITGGCGALYDGASPDGSTDQKSITRVHQAYGRDYQLPNATAHNETCAAIGNVLWNWRMMRITGDAKYADLLEQSLYNAVLAGVSLDGTSFFYTNPLRQLDPMPVELRWSRSRQPWISCFCCPPNVVRTIAGSAGLAYAKSDRGLWIILYGSGTYRASLSDGTAVTLTQTTEYPWDGKARVTIGISAPREFSLMLRVPGWVSNGAATVRVNGGEHAVRPRPGTFHEIRHTWSDGDVVEVDLPMPARLIEAHPLVEEALNQVAVARGPIVYCLESIDLPSGVRVLDVRVPRNATLKPRRDAELLAGIVVVETQGVSTPRGDASSRLYRDVTPLAEKPVDLKLVPYYAWANRGKSEMTVWLPAGR